MGFFRRERPVQITREQAMSARPVRNPSIEATRDEKGEVSLKIPRRKTRFVNLLARFGGIPEHKIVTLDAIGAGVWDLCDGQHSVKDLVAAVADKHKLSRKEAEVSLVTYLRQLAQRGIIALEVPDEMKDKA
jgi:hypothetical protein